MYILHTSVDPNGPFMLYEVWQSEAHWRSHLETEHLVKFKRIASADNLLMTVEKYIFS